MFLRPLIDSCCIPSISKVELHVCLPKCISSFNHVYILFPSFVNNNWSCENIFCMRQSKIEEIGEGYIYILILSWNISIVTSTIENVSIDTCVTENRA